MRDVQSEVQRLTERIAARRRLRQSVADLEARRKELITRQLARESGLRRRRRVA